MSSNEYSPYAPIRVREETWWKYAVHCAKSNCVTADGLISGNLPQKIWQELVVPSMTAIKQSALLSNEKSVGGAVAKIHNFRHWIPMIAQYELCGRQIFDMGDELVEMLAHTDFGDATLADWHPPYDAFYVRFGKRSDICLPFDDSTNEYLDGAFVATSVWNSPPEFRLKIGFMTVKNDGRGVMMPGHFLDLIPSELAMPVVQGIEAAFRRRIDSLLVEDRDNDERLHALISCRTAAVEEAAALIKQAAALLVNSLFYLETVEHEHTRQPGRDTPNVDAALWTKASPEKRHRMRSRLTKDGYAIVYMVGQELAQAAPYARSDGSVSAHWRRGHWRLQPYGPQRSYVRRIWIKPVMVGSEGSASTPGHVYIPPAYHAS